MRIDTDGLRETVANATVMHTTDCLDAMRSMPDDMFDLVFTSPPYTDARTYGVDFKKKGDEWVDWAFERYMECVRVCRGLVCWVVEGRTRSFQWDATPALLMAKLHNAGVKLRKPPAYHRKGIPGSGGPDFWRNDYEFVICSSKGKLPWSDNTATGHPPKYAPGGPMSHRRRDCDRVGKKEYTPPAKANPGNIIHCKVGKGHMGDDLCHENEAPFPESLVKPFVLSFCPEGGLVLDPFCGSGTVLSVAMKCNRRSLGMDFRESQVDLTQRRIAKVQEGILYGEGEQVHSGVGSSDIEGGDFTAAEHLGSVDGTVAGMDA